MTLRLLLTVVTLTTEWSCGLGELNAAWFEQSRDELVTLDQDSIESLPPVSDSTFDWPVLPYNLVNISNSRYFELIDLNIVNQISEATLGVITIYKKINTQPISNANEHPHWQLLPFTVGTCVLVQDNLPNHIPSDAYVSRVERSKHGSRTHTHTRTHTQSTSHAPNGVKNEWQRSQDALEQARRHNNPNYFSFDEFDKIPLVEGHEESVISQHYRSQQEQHQNNENIENIGNKEISHKTAKTTQNTKSQQNAANAAKAANAEKERLREIEANSDEYTLYSKQLNCLTSYQNVRPYTRFYATDASDLARNGNAGNSGKNTKKRRKKDKNAKDKNVASKYLCSTPYEQDNDCYAIAKTYITSNVEHFLKMYLSEGVTDAYRQQNFLSKDFEFVAPNPPLDSKFVQFLVQKHGGNVPQSRQDQMRRDLALKRVNRRNADNAFFIIPATNVFYPILTKSVESDRSANDFDAQESIAFNLALVNLKRHQFDTGNIKHYRLLSRSLPICDADHVWQTQQEIFSIGHASAASKLRFQRFSTRSAANAKDSKKERDDAKRRGEENALFTKNLDGKGPEILAPQQSQLGANGDGSDSEAFARRRELLVEQKHVWRERSELYVSSGRFGKWLYGSNTGSGSDGEKMGQMVHKDPSTFGTGLYWLSVNSAMAGAVVSPFRVSPDRMEQDDKYCVNMIHSMGDGQFPNGVKINMTVVRMLKLNRALRAPVIDNLDGKEREKKNIKLFDESVLKIDREEWINTFEVVKQERERVVNEEMKKRDEENVCEENGGVACTSSADAATKDDSAQKAREGGLWNIL